MSAHSRTPRHFFPILMIKSGIHQKIHRSQLCLCCTPGISLPTLGLTLPLLLPHMSQAEFSTWTSSWCDVQNEGDPTKLYESKE